MNNSKSALWIGVVLIVLALSGVLGQLVSFTLGLIGLIISLLFLLFGLFLLQMYFSAKKYQKNQQAYMRNSGESSIFVNITSDTQDLPITEAEIVSEEG